MSDKSNAERVIDRAPERTRQPAAPLLGSQADRRRRIGQLIDAALIAAALSSLRLGPDRDLFTLFALLALALHRLMGRRAIEWILTRRRRPSSVGLVGTTISNRRWMEMLSERSHWGLAPKGCLDLRREGLGELERLLHDQAIERVILCAAGVPAAKVQAVVRACETEGVEVWMVPDVPVSERARLEPDVLAGEAMIRYCSTPRPSWQLAAKRGIDLVGAAIGLLLLGPLVLLPTAIAIRVTSPGPILFRQKRCGRYGQVFEMLKFRSMVVDAEQRRGDLEGANEQTGPVFKMKHDPRVTPVGRIIRKLSIDELPQLWNVLRGDMSLVGPRPALPSEVAKYRPWQRRRLSITPGLTCTWQVSGRNRIGFERWVEMDLEYIDRWSLAADLKLLAKTIPVVATGYGAS